MWQTWTDDEVAFLIDLRGKGHSSRKIAKLLKAKFTTRSFTRNSVLGKLHRLGLCLHISETDHSLRIQEGMRWSKKYTPKFKTYPLPEETETPSETAVTFADLEDIHCRYPFGEGTTMVFCGKEKTMGSSYCVDHHIKCFRGE